MLKTGFKDIFHNDTRSLCCGEQYCCRLLKVCRKSGIGIGFDIDFAQPLIAAYADTVSVFLHLHAHLLKLCCQRFHVHRHDIFHRHIALCGRSGDHQRSRLDLIWYDAISAAMQFFHAADLYGIRSSALDARTHAV